MLTRNKTHQASCGERGGALVAAVTVVATVGMLSAMTFQLNQSTWQRQLTENDKKRAFYLAESGLAESMAALSMGLGGNVASRVEPAAFGEGFVFSEVLEDQFGLLHVDAYGICGDARHHLAVVLGKLHVPLAREGFFGDEFVRVGESSTLGAAPNPGSGGGSGEVPKADDGQAETAEPALPVDPDLEVKPARIDMQKAKLRRRDGENWKVEWQGGGDFKLNAWDAPEPGGEKYGSGLALTAADHRPTPPADQTAKLGSNGPITIEPGTTTTTTIDASVHPGPGESVTPGVGVTITGATTPREELSELPALDVPVLNASGDLLATRGAALVLNQPYDEYGTISIDGVSSVTLQGPAQVVCTSLTLASGAFLIVDSTNGPVELHVRDTLVMQPAAQIQNVTADSTGLLVYVHGEDSVSGTPEKAILQGSGTFHGLFYAPRANLALPASMHFVGSVLARSLDIEANSNLTFDPALLNESYASVELEPLSWTIDDVPAIMHPRNYDPDTTYRFLGRTPPLLNDSWQSTDQVIHYTDVEGNDFIYRGNELDVMPPSVSVVIDNLVDTDPGFTEFATIPGVIQPLQVP